MESFTLLLIAFLAVVAVYVLGIGYVVRLLKRFERRLDEISRELRRVRREA